MSGFLIVVLHFAAGHLIAPASAALIIPTAIASCLCEQLTVGAGQVFQTFEKMSITATLNLLTSLARTLTAGAMLFVLHRATALEWVIASAVVSAMAAIAAVSMVTIKFGGPQDYSPAVSEAWSRGCRVCNFSVGRHCIQRPR